MKFLVTTRAGTYILSRCHNYACCHKYRKSTTCWDCKEAYRPYWSPEYSLFYWNQMLNTHIQDRHCSLNFLKVDNVWWRTNADNKWSLDNDQRKMNARCTCNLIYINTHVHACVYNNLFIKRHDKRNTQTHVNINSALFWINYNS